MLVPGLFPPQQGQELTDHGAGLYAVPTFPNSFMGPIAGYPSNALIPFTYHVPTGPSPSEAGTGGEEQVQAGQQQQQQAGQQRQVVRDLLVQHQEVPKKRLVLLIFFASLIYLYQTGALAPLIRWLSQGMQRAATPPQQPRPAVRADNVPAAARQENENAPLGVPSTPFNIIACESTPLSDDPSASLKMKNRPAVMQISLRTNKRMVQSMGTTDGGGSLKKFN
ncbi:hypothetical protein Tco_0886253 [Tanacetum coccineum]